MSDIRDVFSKNLIRYRKEQNMSQEELAHRCGLHRTYISLVERKKQSPRLEKIAKIAIGLNLDDYKLFIEEKK